MPTAKKQKSSQATILDEGIDSKLAELLAEGLDPKCKKSRIDIARSSLTVLLVDDESSGCTPSRADKGRSIHEMPQIKKLGPDWEELWGKNELPKWLRSETENDNSKRRPPKAEEQNPI